VFTESIAKLHILLDNHGIDTDTDNDNDAEKNLMRCRNALICHVVSGCCVRPGAPNHGCRLLSKEFSSPLNMTSTVINMLLTSRVSTDKLECFVRALDLEVPPSPNEPTQRCPSSALRRCLTYLLSKPRIPSFPEHVFQSFEKLKKQDLQQIASAHGIHFTHRTDNGELRRRSIRPSNEMVRKINATWIETIH
jgi:hypothetical protein